MTKKSLRPPVPRHSSFLFKLAYYTDASAGLEECWPWTGELTSDGYGYVSNKPVKLRAHRVMWEHLFGSPGQLHVLHECDNRVCVNPLHLFLGTNLDNIADMIAKGRSLKGERNPLAKLTSGIVRAIRQDVRPDAEVAAYYGVKPSTIYAVRTGKSWSWVI